MSEKRGIQFVLTTAIGGVVFLIPVVVLVVVIAKAIGFMMVVAKPMADWLPVDTIGGVAKVLVNVPGYLMVKSLVSGFDESRIAGLKPVALQLGTAERVGYEIEKLPDGRSMVFIPSPPNPFSGITQVLPPEQVTYLDVSLKQIMEVTENFGHGVHEILAKKKQADA
jgi:uncharacterized membrane protein